MKQILYRTLAAIIVSATVCCCNCRPQQVTEESQKDLFETVFRNKALQDSLNAFIQETRECTDYDTLVYSVMIQDCDIMNRTVDNDTMILFILSDQIIQDLDFYNADRSTVVGAIQRGNEILAVSYFDHKHGMDKVVNEDIFDMKLYFKYLEHYDETPYNWAASDEYKTDGQGNLININKYRNGHLSSYTAEKYRILY